MELHFNSPEEESVFRAYSVDPNYVQELYQLQTELLKLQKYVYESNMRLAIIFEGRDTAGKGSAIFRFSQFLNPRHYRVVALGKPTAAEQGQWYFQRYVKRLPNPGEIVFFDRSWYNRAVVEPVMGFCTPAQHERFLKQAPLLEQMLIEDGLLLIKFWFSIDMEVQRNRIEDRLTNPLKQWKVSPVDLAAQEKWQEFSHHKAVMYERTHTDYSPWIVVRGNQREPARIAAMRYVLNTIEYPDRSEELRLPDGEILGAYKSVAGK